MVVGNQLSVQYLVGSLDGGIAKFKMEFRVCEYFRRKPDLSIPGPIHYKPQTPNDKTSHKYASEDNFFQGTRVDY